MRKFGNVRIWGSKFPVFLVFTLLLGCRAKRHVMELRDVPLSAVRYPYRPSVIFKDGSIQIDTFVILQNINLQRLVGILKRSHLVDKEKVADIPPFIQARLDSMVKKPFTMAEKGESYSSGCVIMGPRRQLGYMGVGDSIFLMSYMHGHGNYGPSSHTLIFRFENERIIDFWVAGGGYYTGRKELMDHLEVEQNFSPQWDDSIEF